jgi:hypothetical protein
MWLRVCFLMTLKSTGVAAFSSGFEVVPFLAKEYDFLVSE